VYERILQNCGISDIFRKKTFSNFDDTDKPTEVKEAKKAAMQYVKDFTTIRNQRANSIAFLGQVGSGKTHLSCAVANNLMSKCIGVLYMPYREAIMHSNSRSGTKKITTERSRSTKPRLPY
jgi:DNA replication protein DnaC